MSEMSGWRYPRLSGRGFRPTGLEPMLGGDRGRERASLGQAAAEFGNVVLNQALLVPPEGGEACLRTDIMIEELEGLRFRKIYEQVRGFPKAWGWAKRFLLPAQAGWYARWLAAGLGMEPPRDHFWDRHYNMVYLSWVDTAWPVDHPDELQLTSIISSCGRGDTNRITLRGGGGGVELYIDRNMLVTLIVNQEEPRVSLREEFSYTEAGNGLVVRRIDPEVLY